MKKTLLFFYFLLLNFYTQAQDLKGWHIGVTLQPYNYWLYNKYDVKVAGTSNNNGLTFINPKLGIPNGFAGGVTASKFYSDRFGLKAELAYSTQTQKYDYFIGYENTTYSNYTKLNFLKLPIMATYVLLPERNNNIYFSAGLQMSYLTGFVKSDVYKNSLTGQFFNNYTTKKEAHYISSSSLNVKDTVFYDAIRKDKRYKPIQIGGIAEIGYLHSFNDNLNLFLGIRGEYDFNNLKNLSYTINGFNQWSDDNGGTGSDKNRVPSHNIRLGINLSITYKLDR
jgi:hypothetical protein